MGNELIPLIITIAIASVIIVGANIATFVILLNHLSERIDQMSTDLGGRIDQSGLRIIQAAAKNKAELLDAIRDSERRLTESTRDSEQRLSRRLDRFEDKTDANFEALRRESSERPAEHPVAGDD